MQFNPTTQVCRRIPSARTVPYRPVRYQADGRTQALSMAKIVLGSRSDCYQMGSASCERHSKFFRSKYLTFQPVDSALSREGHATIVAEQRERHSYETQIGTSKNQEIVAPSCLIVQVYL